MALRSYVSGAWFEARDAEGNLLYYRHLHDPMPATREAFGDAKGQPSLSRVPREAQQGDPKDQRELAHDGPSCGARNVRIPRPR